QPQYERRHDDIHAEEGGDMVLEKLSEEQRHIKAVCRQKRDELQERKNRTQDSCDKIKPLHKHLFLLRLFVVLCRFDSPSGSASFFFRPFSVPVTGTRG